MLTKPATMTTTIIIIITITSLSLLLLTFHPLLISSQPGHQGEWRLLLPNIGISAMHMQLLHNNKVVMFDRTDFGPSNLTFPNNRCRFDPSDAALQLDCTAHSVLYDISTNHITPLMIHTDTWCSSGSLLPNGTLLQTGGFHDGDLVIRMFTPPSDQFVNSDWIEFPNYLTRRRWYATNQILPDGRVIIVGGRRQHNYEFYPSDSKFYWLDLLRETRDGRLENNLYPFLHLLPDGNLFIFSNNRSILFNYFENRVLTEYPAIPGGDPRNYPSSGSSVLLPLVDNGTPSQIEAEVMVCGGASQGAARLATEGNFLPAIASCARLRVSDRNPSWKVETMPVARVMGDMLLLPTGDVIIINGAGRGTAGWENGRDPVTTPVVYRPHAPHAWRFTVMAPSPTARMYHSCAVVLGDGRVLIGGSNPHVFYNFTNVMYPTELKLDTFLPPYLLSVYDPVRPRVLGAGTVVAVTRSYGDVIRVSFCVDRYMSKAAVSVRMVAPSFTTHSFAMNQRMVVLRIVDVEKKRKDPDIYSLGALAPSTATIAPPGYYMLFVVHAGIPSSCVWVKLQ
ncbi:Aldehyde oxidase GLOX [Linum grandiflorum]